MFDSNGNYNNYNYYYDQYNNQNYMPGVENTSNLCQNSLNFISSSYNRLDGKMQNYFQTYQQPNNGYSTSYPESYKLVSPYSIQDNIPAAFPCGNYFTNMSYGNNIPSTAETYENNNSFNYGSFNTIFPEIAALSTVDKVDSSESGQINNTKNQIPYVPITSST
ncbi:hypothetical protein HZS_247 [Henneguya salminicola]|nr:hypothetical protein HZS_247 [Henneguya salminicola]